MPITYRNAKKEVDKEYDELIKAGWNPIANDDGETFRWENAKGEIRRGVGEPTQGVNADASWFKQKFKREARQDRLMSEKVTAMLAKKPTKKEGTDNSTVSKPVVSTEKPAEGKVKGSNFFNQTDRSIYKKPVEETYTGPMSRTPKTEYTGPMSPTWSPKSNVPSWMPKAPPKMDKDDHKAVVSIMPSDKDNTSNPFRWVDQEQYIAETPWWKRAMERKFLGTNIGEIANEQGGGTGTMIGMERTGKFIPGSREVNGRTQVLIANDKFNDPATAGDMVSNSVTTIQNLMSPSGVVKATVPALAAAASKGKFGAGAVEAATNLGPRKIDPRWFKDLRTKFWTKLTPGGASKVNAQLGKTSVPIKGNPFKPENLLIQKLPTGMGPATQELTAGQPTIGQAFGQAFPSIWRSANGRIMKAPTTLQFKVGGKLLPRKKG